MNQTVTKKVDDLIISLCDHIEGLIKSDSAEDRESLPSLIEALAKLTR